MFDIDISRILSLLTYDPTSPMIFSSGIFLFLFLGFSLIYCILHKADTARIIFVTLFSYYFYYKSSGIYFLLLAIVTISDFYIARAIAKALPTPAASPSAPVPGASPSGSSATVPDASPSGSYLKPRLLVALSLLIDLSLLAYFKYTNFFGSLIFHDWHNLDIFLPVGVSFFTFQSLSYTIDVYRGNIRPLDRLLDYAFYVSFFPQLVAGPIVRARDFIPQIRRPLLITNRMIGNGIFLIIAGLFKKAVISDYISVNFVERVFDQPTLYSGIENLLAVYGYTLQIYCDFSGYSDMAIGIALLLGFEFPKNFDNPYKSSSITEFWRRWHISLSSWLKDYLYISLGGNRHGKFRQYLNLIITMLLGGLWHGASLNFILWGGIHGIILAFDKMWHSLCPSLSPLPQKRKAATTPNASPSVTSSPAPVPDASPSGTPSSTHCPLSIKVISSLITFHIVASLWVLFRASTFQIASDVFTQIFTAFHPAVLGQWLSSYWPVALLMALGYTLHFLPSTWCNHTRRSVSQLPLPLQAILLVIVIWIVIQVKSSDVQPFIYFQF